MFQDRTDAGRQLAALLHRFAPQRPLVLALPRGGVIVGAVIARKLICDLDVVLVKKLRALDEPELALGAVSEEGRAFVNDEIVRLTGADEAYIEAERRARVSEMAGQRSLYRAVKTRVSPTGRVVILVDDGLATGATMIAAAQATRLANPARLIVAVPVGPPDVVSVIEALREVDEVVCPLIPDGFAGVGQFYRDFRQVEDDEVVTILKEFA